MPSSLDLNLFSLARTAGHVYPELMALHIAEPPRRPARGRKLDRLILYMVMVGNAPLSPGKQEQALEHLTKIYYQTPGSATAAMRSVGEELNRLLLTRNQRIANIGQQGTSLLIQAVSRGEQLYLAHSGPMHAYIVSARETLHFYDPEMEERSLGQSRLAPQRFFQTQLNPSDTVILAALPSAGWDLATLSSIHGQGPESARRRLFSEKMGDVNAVLIQARQGLGKFYLGGAKDSTLESPPERAVESGESIAPQTAPLHAEIELPIEKTAEGKPMPVDAVLQDHPKKAVIPADEGRVAETGELTTLEKDAQVLDAKPAATTRSRAAKDVLASAGKALMLVGTPILNFLRRLGRSGRVALNRVMPEEMIQAIPSSMLAFLAISVPLVVVAVASRAYLSLGLEAQDEALFAQAQQMAVQAMNETDLFAKRAAWEATLKLLDEAGDSSQIEELRAQARGELDAFDSVQRVDYQPAIFGGLPEEVKVTRLVSSGNELYMLDGNSGNVLHAVETSQGYALDNSFQCGSNASSVLLVGPVIDIVAWPAGFDPNASLLAMDSSGNLLFCKPEEPVKTAKLTPPLGSTFGDLKGFALDLGDLYVLDPLLSAVWIFRGSDPGKEPYLFFDREVPVLQDVVDLTVNNDELYLLHADGLMTLCVFSGFEEVPNRCTDLPYVDFRPGRENTPLTPAGQISQVQYTPPPDPSLHVLEQDSHSIYHFSLRNLAFQRQYLPLRPLVSGKATAFAVNNVSRFIFLAVGNSVYYAAIP